MNAQGRELSTGVIHNGDNYTAVIQRPTRRPLGRARRVLAAALTAAVAALSVGAGAAPAQARGWMGRTGYAHGGHTLGTLRPPGYSEQAVCIDTDRDLVTKRTSPERKRQPGLNYLMTRYSQTTSDRDAAALAYLVKDGLGDPGFPRAKAILASLGAATQQRVRERIEELQAEAERFAGPYVMGEPVLATTARPDGTAVGSVSNLGVNAASGAWVADLDLTLRLTGPAVFSENGSRTLTLRSGSEPVEAPFTATGAGEVSLTASTDRVLAGTELNVHPSPPGTSGQRMVTTGPRVSVSAGRVTRVVLAVTARVSSQVSAHLVGTGTTVSDTVRVTTAKHLAGSRVRVSTTVYGPVESRPAESEAVPVGIKEVGTQGADVTLDADGNAEVTFELSRPLNAPGWYVFVEAIADDAEAGLRGARGTFGRESETVFVNQPATIETRASTRVASVGSTISDTAIVAGIVPGLGVTVTLTGELRGPASPVDGGCAAVDWSQAPVATTIVAQPIPADGEYPGLGEFTVAKAGCYSYGEQLTATLEGKPWWQTDHPAGKTPQTTVVTAPPVPTVPTVSPSAPVPTVSPVPTVPRVSPSAPVPGLTVNSGLADHLPRNPVLGALGAISGLGLAGALARRRRKSGSP